nr:uncharacterized protein LOC110282744 [Parasteatoda tepidariorum]
MKVVEKKSVLTVEFTKTHIGHKNDIGRMKLSDQERNVIASKLLNKIPISVILDDIRESLTDELQAVHLLTRKDILNIKNQYNVCNGVLDSSDAVSVETWVENMKGSEGSPVVLYKPQSSTHDILTPENFLLVIMNPSQTHMLSQYENDVICIDFTHGVNAYGFDLATIVVLDDKREGFPAAFIISNRQDSVALSVALHAIKHICGNISPKVLMTDDAESFNNAWKDTFGEPQKRLLCSWHMDRSWRKKLSELVPNKEEQANIYKIIRCLLSEPDLNTFIVLAENAVKLFQDNEVSKRFGVYFEKNYLRRAEVWAYSYRKWAGLNTNMHIERMHRTIKCIYLEGEKVKRLDKTIHCLMQFVRDKLFDRLIALEKGKISTLRNRHKTSKSLTSDIYPQNENEWVIHSQTRIGEMYYVRKADECSKECPLLCKECGYCIQNFTCSCIDNAIQWNMCKHIHAVCSQVKDAAVSTEVVDNNIETSPEDDLIIDENELQVIKDNEKDVHVTSLKRKVEDIDELKSDVKKLHIELGKVIEECDSQE